MKCRNNKKELHSFCNKSTSNLGHKRGKFTSYVSNMFCAMSMRREKICEQN